MDLVQRVRPSSCERFVGSPTLPYCRDAPVPVRVANRMHGIRIVAATLSAAAHVNYLRVVIVGPGKPPTEAAE